MSHTDITRDLDLYYTSNKRMKIPRILNNYTILKKIAETRFSVVVSAKISNSPSKFAIKCIPINFYKKHKNEIEIITAVDHPNIIRCIDSFKYPSTNKRFFAIVMPCATGDLVGYLKFHHFIEEPIACIIMRDILSAVYYLHARNIIHRDIKCDNIFIMEENLNGLRTAIGDFGLSIRSDGSPINGLPAGTSAYAPPELLVKNKEDTYGISLNNQNVIYDKSVDMFSLGIVMFGILSGLHPFKSKAGYLINDHLNGRIVFRSDDPSNFLLPLLPNDIFNTVSIEAKNLILSMTCADPKSRITAEQALNHPWFLLFRGVTNIPPRIENNTHVNIDVEAENDNDNDIET